ncbi:hypothetical protein [Pseudomonas aeruginosa]
MRQLDKDQQGALQQSAFRPLQQTAFQASICERIQGGLANAGIVASRMGGQEIRNWLIRWFNPHWRPSPSPP